MRSYLVDIWPMLLVVTLAVSIFACTVILAGRPQIARPCNNCMEVSNDGGKTWSIATWRSQTAK